MDLINSDHFDLIERQMKAACSLQVHLLSFTLHHEALLGLNQFDTTRFTATEGKMAKLVDLVPMCQLSEARSDDDNWTGLKDQKERRRRQTRLALRLHRIYILIWR